MTLNIELNLEAETKLRAEATRRGVEPEVYAKQIIEEHLPPREEGAAIDQGTLDLLARWDSEDATSDPGEISSRGRDLEEFKRAMNDNRAREEGPNARRIYP